MKKKMYKNYLRLRLGVRICCCDGVCCEPERVRRDGVIGSFCCGVCGPAFSLRARFDGVPFGVDIFSTQQIKKSLTKTKLQIEQRIELLKYSLELLGVSLDTFCTWRVSERQISLCNKLECYNAIEKVIFGAKTHNCRL